MKVVLKRRPAALLPPLGMEGNSNHVVPGHYGCSQLHESVIPKADTKDFLTDKYMACHEYWLSLDS